ncbi:MAG TPA: heme ABC transporter permease CcmC [Thermohalobaculum sp.]|nr:heme ABC transporter permease CcmC [Thermohalobaculum sp.]
MTTARPSIWRYANPAEFMALTRRLLMPVWVATVALMALGLGWSLLAVPDDYQQGSTVKIMFIHVPAAMLAINTYAVMAAASLIGLVRRHHVSFLVAKAAAPIGAAFTAIALITGAVWGQPMWGTWWVWDARLTAVLIMFFFYLGYIALWVAIDEPEKAADLSAVLCLVGVVFAFLARYAVMFWATLHQGASLSVAAGQRVDDAFRTPLYVMIAAFYLLFIALLLVRARTEVRRRRLRAIALAEARTA